MNVLEHTRQVAARAQADLRVWLAAILADAGAGTVSVALSPTDIPTTPRLALHPIRVGVPGRSVDVQGVSLLAPSDSVREAPQGVSPVWIEYARCLRACMEPVFFAGAGRPPPGARPRMPTALADVPAPMARWYEARASESEDWIFAIDGKRVVRSPALTYRPGGMLKAQYFVTLDAFGDDAVPLLAALSSSFAFQSSFSVDAPPLPVDPLIGSFSEALAASVPQELGGELTLAVGALRQPTRTVVAVMPHSEFTFSEALRFFDRQGLPYAPHVQIAVFVPVGATAMFSPTAAPQYVPADPGRS